MAAVAAEHGLNAKYFEALWNMLNQDAAPGGSLVLNRIRVLWREARLAEAKPLVEMKFQQETGFDPSLLDTPDAPVPDGVQNGGDDDGGGGAPAPAPPEGPRGAASCPPARQPPLPCSRSSERCLEAPQGSCRGSGLLCSSPPRSAHALRAPSTPSDAALEPSTSRSLLGLSHHTVVGLWRGCKG